MVLAMFLFWCFLLLWFPVIVGCFALTCGRERTALWGGLLYELRCFGLLKLLLSVGCTFGGWSLLIVLGLIDTGCWFCRL